MKQTLKNHYQRKVAIAALCLLTFSISAQERYSFHCQEYISTDNNRAPQTNFSYDTAKNLFAIKSSGTNNVAFKMSSEADGKYYIPNDNYWFVIAAKNVNTTLSDSRVWWFNGYCNGGQSPTKVFTNSDATQLLMWNIKSSGSMGTNMDFTQQKIVISSHNNEFIHAIGLTSSIGKGTITDVNYYAPYEIAGKYPKLIASMGYNNTTLTTKLISKTDSLLTIAESKLNGKINNTKALDSLKKAQEEVKVNRDTISANNYASAFSLYQKIDGTLLYFDNNNHNVSYTKTDNGINGVYDSLHVKIVFYTDGIVRVYKSYLPEEKKTSLSVVKHPESGLSLTYKDEGDSVEISSSLMRVVYTMKTAHVSIYKNKGENIVNENSFSMNPMKIGRAHV